MSQGDANPPSDPQAAATGETLVAARHVVFSHGKESGPWGRKISSLAEVARSEGYEAHSVDYRGLDEPRQRVTRLVEFCKELSGELVLVGSSLGGYVAVASASLLHARGVFLMAPALYMPGLPEMRPGVLDCPTTVVHGWRDDVVPFDHSVRFAQSYRAALHLLESDHNLHNQIRVIQYLFEYFLIALDLPALAFE
ncbi:MAG TPA: alpha/beta hydrolase [Steroidobacteraceae bacterium]|nr:alpha/beta hydrolase [Steroidobacteraceae bacterium]